MAIQSFSQFLEMQINRMGFCWPKIPPSLQMIFWLLIYWFGEKVFSSAVYSVHSTIQCAIQQTPFNGHTQFTNGPPTTGLDWTGLPRRSDSFADRIGDQCQLLIITCRGTQNWNGETPCATTWNLQANRVTHWTWVSISRPTKMIVWDRRCNIIPQNLHIWMNDVCAFCTVWTCCVQLTPAR